jgi:putative phage-type endonuclease
VTLTGRRIPPLVPGSPEWQRVMSASKVAAVLGLSPYQSRYSLWHTMRGNIAPEGDSAVKRRGHYLEPAIAEWWQDQHPNLVLVPGGCYAHPDHEWYTASPDRIVWHLLAPGNSLAQAALLEVKSASDDREWGEPGTDQIPIGYRAQVMAQMDVTGARVCHVAVLTGRLEFREYVVEYDEDEATFVREACLSFMDSLAANELPDIDSHSSTYEAVRRLHPDIQDVDVDVDPLLVNRWQAACAAKKDADAEWRQMSSLLLDAIGDGRRAVIDGELVATRSKRGEGAPYLIAPRGRRAAA